MANCVSNKESDDVQVFYIVRCDEACLGTDAV